MSEDEGASGRLADHACVSGAARPASPIEPSCFGSNWYAVAWSTGAGFAAVTTSLGGDDAYPAGAGPMLLLARTSERTVEPTSPWTGVYWELVSPEMSTQLEPLLSQRCHW